MTKIPKRSTHSLCVKLIFIVGILVGLLLSYASPAQAAVSDEEMWDSWLRFDPFNLRVKTPYRLNLRVKTPYRPFRQSSSVPAASVPTNASALTSRVTGKPSSFFASAPVQRVQRIRIPYRPPLRSPFRPPL